jgi:thiol:disulfide interchange protein DsbD
MIRKIIWLLLFPIFIFAQEPTSWSYEVKKISDDEANIIFNVSIQDGWCLYSLKTKGALPGEFIFEKNPAYKLIGSTTESPKPKSKYEPDLGATTTFFEGKATFTQKIKILKPELFNIEVYYSGQACLHDGMCVMVKKDFLIPIDGSLYKPQLSSIVNSDNDINEQNNLLTYADTSKLTTEVDTSIYTKIFGINPLDSAMQAYNAQYLVERSEAKHSNRSLWGIFFAGLLGGLVALVTPCVWPMIPLTVSFFIKRNKKKGIKDAIIYGLSIIIIYVTLGLLITIIFGANALNALSTNPWFNLFFFVLLLVFAIAFFGGFDLTLPSSWVNAMDRRAERATGLLSIFFMAFTLVLVSFSCTGPIIGTLLVEAITEGYLAPFIGMLGFSIALALPFTLFALFPQMISNLPKSGGWMNTVKVTLGFIELFFAFKFLSVADLASHWGILDREIFIVIWVGIAFIMGLYFLDVIRFKGEEKKQHLSVIRFFLALASFAFTFYLIPGLWGAPLKGVSAFLPPIYTQDFNMNDQHVKANYKDLTPAIEFARNVNKPILIDFSGYGCVNCREMEASVWTDPKVKDFLENNFVLVSLYVDDKTLLPVEQAITIDDGNIKTKLRTIGDKWSFLEYSLVKRQSQPMYVIMDHNGRILNELYGYNKNPNAFLEWLQEGLEAYYLVNR